MSGSDAEPPTKIGKVKPKREALQEANLAVGQGMLKSFQDIATALRGPVPFDTHFKSNDDFLIGVLQLSAEKAKTVSAQWPLPIDLASLSSDEILTAVGGDKLLQRRWITARKQFS